jgi:hypothetical protein
MADAEGWSQANYVEQGIARLLEAAPGPKHKAALSAGRIIYLAGRLLPKRVKNGPERPVIRLLQYPRERTSLRSVGMSQTCHEETSPPGAMINKALTNWWR